MDLQVQDAERVVKFYEADGAIVFVLRGGKIEYVYYGKDDLQCERIRNLTEEMFSVVASEFGQPFVWQEGGPEAKPEN